ncbi:MAG: hypothetical protein IPK13_17965 [Deltaproteobacteria bacterium]|nr:hypothetical protein [Deltaproteobacteria bacterium]
MGRRIVYQVINFTREEMFFGTTDVHLEKEIERIAKDPSGPAADWQKGDIVHWRPLTDPLEEESARSIHRELESRPKPNKYRVIQTFVGPELA